MISNTNDGTQAPPRLRLDIAMGSITSLPEESSGPRGSAIYAAVKAAGFEGIQGGDDRLCREVGLRSTGMGRVNKVGEADAIATSAIERQQDCVTLHVGWGTEDDDEALRIFEDILRVSERRKIPMYIETHRATLTQDQWRTVQWVKRLPELRFNGDFSHWYTGLEMVYGGFENKLEFMAPVIERVRFMHGRIGNPGCMQVDIGDGTGQQYVDHFRQIWTRCFSAFLSAAKPGDYICFTPELLGPSIYYAQLHRDSAGKLIEVGDRWQQSLLYAKIARECWDEAKRGVGTSQALPAAATA